jgi:hypothetical protein
MSSKVDDDLKTMTVAQLQDEVMKCRTAVRKEVKSTGNERCWITLHKVLPENSTIDPLTLPESEFIANCRRYHRRNQ